MNVLPARIQKTLSGAFPPRRSIQAQNEWFLYADVAWYGLLFGIAQAFVPILTIRLGGTDLHVGLLSALPALMAIFFSIPASRLVEKEKKSLSVLIATITLHRVGYLALALVPFLIDMHRADSVIIIVALLTIPNAMANVAFTTMFGRAVLPGDRPRVVSIRNILVGISSTAAALIGGKFLDLVLFPVNYQILFVIAFLTSQISTYYLWRIHLPPEPVTSPTEATQTRRGWSDYVAMFRSNPLYARFTLSAVVVHLGLYFAIPLYSIYWVRNLNASEGWVGLVTMVGSGTTILFYPLWARLSSHRGNRYVLGISVAALALYPLFTAWSPTIEWIVLVQFWGGIFTGAFTLSLFNGLLEVCPEQNRATHIAAFNTLINAAAFISPIISTSLTPWLGVPLLLIVGAGTRLVAALSFWRRAMR